ncbi:MAG: hypothetical protein D6736_15635 [Nitrospinota bacterium]|nr:MAG: hypothetical protein D6736_15635 [Nitrospinota bacterium]
MSKRQGSTSCRFLIQRGQIMDNAAILTQAMFQMIREHYGSRLTPEQLEEIRQGIEANVQLGLALARVPLANRDEPFTVFTPYRAPGGEVS